MSRYDYLHIVCDDCHNAPCQCKPLNWCWKSIPMQLQRKWHARYVAKCAAIHEDPTPQWQYDLLAAALVVSGFHQTSRKYRTVSQGDFREPQFTLDERTFKSFRALTEMKWRKQYNY